MSVTSNYLNLLHWLSKLNLPSGQIQNKQNYDNNHKETL